MHQGEIEVEHPVSSDKNASRVNLVELAVAGVGQVDPEMHNANSVLDESKKRERTRKSNRKAPERGRKASNSIKKTKDIALNFGTVPRDALVNAEDGATNSNGLRFTVGPAGLDDGFDFVSPP